MENNLTSIHEDTGLILGLAQWDKGYCIAVSCGVGHRCGLDLVWLWLWLWHRPVATAPIRPLAWALPYDEGVALKTKNKKDIKEKTDLWPCHLEHPLLNSYDRLYDSGGKECAV